MTPGIAVALAAELRTLTRCPVAPGECARLPGGALVALGGPGSERARAAAGRLLAGGATALVSWGVAAGLDPSLRPGSLLLPERVIGADGTSYRVTTAWHAALHTQMGLHTPPHVGPLVEVRDVLERPSEKGALFERSGAIAADMESAALACVAVERHVPFLVVRAVADPAGGRVPGWAVRLVGVTGRVRAAQALALALAHPGDWGALIALARAFWAARRTLSRVGPVLWSTRPGKIAG
ncbi:MAG TPA: hypothetical protein VEU55_03225 [Gemmatimonadales bacterium]|nr:hypothetical protein [Gemmatimonadales bacterium]